MLKWNSITGMAKLRKVDLRSRKPFSISGHSKLKLFGPRSLFHQTHTHKYTYMHTHTHTVLLFTLKPIHNRKHAYVRTIALKNGLCKAPQ